ncbi:Flp pilus assembly protein TadG [Allocatelliglobosispora scoriae]|uniref:Flp pilus assembly protein TadG n=1 Tax=Allocatelliglobosispora scoriae TaxID=643052 RepID=A0A841BQG1_9ACTN|nr:TadE/TadG family type IV pilus assembly protein [Allocatelliglobosispora scoriae]MBB5869618.1 Flp pilus assembly protein TadG [Allocatelliglobosispora scoriae]
MSGTTERRRFPLRPAGRSGRHDQGDGPIEMVIIAVPTVLITLMVIHAGLYFYARSIAIGAASQGVNAARSYDASERTTGAAKAREFIDAMGPGLNNVQVNQITTPTSVTVIVSGDMPTLVPGITIRVLQRAVRPIERVS